MISHEKENQLEFKQKTEIKSQWVSLKDFGHKILKHKLLSKLSRKK